MSEGEQNRSEAASPFKLRKAREKGSVARGADLGFLAGMAALLAVAAMLGDDIGSELTIAMRRALVAAPLLEGGASAWAATGLILAPLMRPLGLALGVMMLIAAALDFLQTGPLFSTTPLKPDFKRLNPAQNFKRLFSLRMLIEAAKALLKLAAYGAVVTLVIAAAVREGTSAALDAGMLAALLEARSMRLLAIFCGVALAFATIDQLIVRRQFTKQMRMSRREMKQEHKDREGDPRLKSRRKQVHREMAQHGRSLRGARDADMMIVNPEHVAIGLRYRPATMAAPLVVARGQGEIAQRLKRIGFLHQVPIVEDKALARQLLRFSRLDREIPEICYDGVAAHYRRLRPSGAAA